MKITIILSDGQKLEKLFQKSPVVIGRSKLCDFQVTDESLSRQHCQIEMNAGEFYITDLGSSNGVYFDGQRIAPHERLKFNTFLQLTIGALECRPSDENTTGGFASPFKQNITFTHKDLVSNLELSPTTTTVGPPTKTTRKINSNALNDRKIETVTKTGPSTKKMPWFIPLLAMAIVAYALFNQSEVKQIKRVEKTAVEPQYKKDLQVMKALPNVFKETSSYLEEEKKRGCLNMEVFCQKMNLALVTEGLYQDGNNLSIFLNPNLYVEDNRYRLIVNNPDKLSIIAMDRFLTSEPMNQFYIKENLQIHLAVKGPEGDILEVYRFHPALYNHKTTNRMEAIQLLESAIGTGDSTPFWSYIARFVPKKVF